MPLKQYQVTHKDCFDVINGLLKILDIFCLGREVDFVIYGSFLESWRNGLSDLDGILYFKNSSPVSPSLRSDIRRFQKAIAELYRNLPFLKSSHFLSDIFILDPLHVEDGRFMIFDCDFIYEFWNYTAYQFLRGPQFVRNFRPVMFRNQHEFELATGLHKLRNYLLFEVPRLPQEMSLPWATEVLKFFRILPRVATRLAERPMAKSLADLESCFTGVNYQPLRDLWAKTTDSSSQERYLQSWHEPENTAFLSCLECFELTLIELVKNYPMKSLTNSA